MSEEVLKQDIVSEENDLVFSNKFDEEVCCLENLRTKISNRVNNI